MLTPASAIAIIGFGATGRSIAMPLAQRGVAVRAWDRLLDACGQQMRQRIEAAGVDPASTLVETLRGAKLVIVAVGAAASQQAAQTVAPLLVPGQVYLDLCAGSMLQHQGNALLVERHGAHYVAGQLDAPLLLAGVRAAGLAAALCTLGCAARVVESAQYFTSNYRDAPGNSARLRSEAATGTPLRGELP